MAILAPAELPSVIKVNDTEMKKYVLSKLGYPHVAVELSEDQWEVIWRVAGDFIAGYFPKEQRLSVFWTSPLKNTYPFPEDAYWIQSVDWNPLYTNLDMVFGAESYLYNIGNMVGGLQNIILDYHLMQAYRKSSQFYLGTDGRWEVIGEVDGESKDQLIRLYPTPKGAFPVLVQYIPIVNHFRSPQARQLAYDMMLAEAKIAVGMARRKITGMPTPDGGSISYDGGDLIGEGEKAKEGILQYALNLGEPIGIWMHSILLMIMADIFRNLI